VTGVGRNRHNEGVVVGYYSMQLVAPVSLTDHVLKPNGGGVRVEDMLPFTRARPLECYIIGFTSPILKEINSSAKPHEPAPKASATPITVKRFHPLNGRISPIFKKIIG